MGLWSCVVHETKERSIGGETKDLIWWILLGPYKTSGANDFKGLHLLSGERWDWDWDRTLNTFSSNLQLGGSMMAHDKTSGTKVEFRSKSTGKWFQLERVKNDRKPDNECLKIKIIRQQNIPLKILGISIDCVEIFHLQYPLKKKKKNSKKLRTLNLLTPWLALLMSVYPFPLSFLVMDTVKVICWQIYTRLWKKT